MKTLMNYMNFAKSALTLAAVAALVILFWPGALAAVTSFAVLGLSIAAVVGSNILLQTGAVALLAFAGLHVLGLAIDAVSGLFSLAKNCFCASSKDESKTAKEYVTVNHSYSEMLQNQSAAQKNRHSDTQPVHTSLYPKVNLDNSYVQPSNTAPHP